ncbi:MAG: hypothetical protein HFJ50_02415 [Clostridia bacterium]|jgi:hypothetical protein|nr:hypothetical protein [Clostridia bacterium]
MRKSRTLLACLAIVLAFCILVPTCLAISSGEELVEKSVASADAIIDAFTNSVRGNSAELSDSSYEVIRTYLKEHKLGITHDDGSVSWELSDYYSLVLNPDRTVELWNGAWVIKDQASNWQTIDFAGLAEPSFKVFGFAGNTWMIDYVDGILRCWTLGIENEDLCQKINAELDPDVTFFEFSVYSPLAGDKNSCYIYNSMGELLMLEKNGKLTKIADDFAHFVKSGIARKGKSLFYINNSLDLICYNLNTGKIETVAQNVTSLDFSTYTSCKYQTASKWEEIPSLFL